MPSFSDRTPSRVDLSCPTESTRRVLYELVVHVYFHPTPEEVEQARQDPGNHWVPDYGPDAARLHVVYAYGRWFAAWQALEEKEEADATPRRFPSGGAGRWCGSSRTGTRPTRRV